MIIYMICGKDGVGSSPSVFIHIAIPQSRARLQVGDALHPLYVGVLVLYYHLTTAYYNIKWSPNIVPSLRFSYLFNRTFSLWKLISPAIRAGSQSHVFLSVRFVDHMVLA